MIAFFDASALIYLIEGAEPFAAEVRGELVTLEREFPGLRAAVSRLSWLECRVMPMKRNDVAVLTAFDAFFDRNDLVWVELGREVVELATVIRAKTGIKTPDALQAACCLQFGNNHVFLTGDAAFRRVPGLNVKLLS